MYKSLIFVMVLFGGCTINMTPAQEPVEKKIPAQIELKQYKLWPHVKKEYWYAKYFLSMAMNPNVQRMLTPEQVFDVVKCTVDEFEKDYEYERFLREIGDNLRLPPHISKYIYDTSLECSLEVKRKVTEKQDENPLTLKNAI